MGGLVRQGRRGPRADPSGIGREPHPVPRGTLGIQGRHPARQAAWLGNHEHGDRGHIGRLDGIGAFGERQGFEDGRVGRRLPRGGHPLAGRAGHRHAVGGLEEIRLAPRDHRGQPGPRVTGRRIARGEHHGVDARLPGQLDEQPRPLRPAGAARQQDLAGQIPPGARRLGRRHHRRIAHDRQRADRPLKEPGGDRKIIDHIAPRDLCDVRQPAVVAEVGNVSSRIEGRLLEHGLDAGAEVRPHRGNQGVDPPFRSLGRGEVAPLAEPVKGLLVGPLLVEVIEPRHRRDRAGDELVARHAVHGDPRTRRGGRS